MLPDADHRIKLQVFEGPLDLLLFLIRKNEIDIYDIPIESVTKQYVAVLRSMQQLDLDVAGEFFVMAASLMEIKSRMLLPEGPARRRSRCRRRGRDRPAVGARAPAPPVQEIQGCGRLSFRDGSPAARPDGAPGVGAPRRLPRPPAEGGQPDRALEHVQHGAPPAGGKAGRRGDPRRDGDGRRPDGVAPRADARREELHLLQPLRGRRLP